MLFYARDVLVVSSSTAQHVLNNTAIYQKPEADAKAAIDMLGNGLITAEGEIHKRQRKVLNPAFAPGYIRDIVPIFSEKAGELVKLVATQLKSQTAEGINIYPFLKFATLDIIGAAGLSLVSQYLCRFWVRIQFFEKSRRFICTSLRYNHATNRC